MFLSPLPPALAGEEVLLRAFGEHPLESFYPRYLQLVLPTAS